MHETTWLKWGTLALAGAAALLLVVVAFNTSDDLEVVHGSPRRSPSTVP